MKPTRYRPLLAASAALLALLPIHTTLAEQRWTYAYDANGQVLHTDGPRTDVADTQTHSYDAAGNRISSTNALGHTTHFSDHNARGQPGRIMDPNGVVTTLRYHPRGWLTAATVHSPGGNSAADATTLYEYDAEGLLIATRDPQGRRLSYDYDAARRLVTVSDTLGRQLRYTLDAAGNRIAESSHSVDGGITRQLTRQFDELDRLLAITSPAGSETRHGYDRNGNRLSSTDGNGNTRLHYYDALDRPIRAQAANGYDLQLQHDARDNLVAVTDPGGLRTGYRYDGYDDLRSIDSPDAGTSRYAYDPTGNRIDTLTARSVSITARYDALNRPIALHHDDSSLDITYHYDEGANGTGRLTAVTDASGQTSFRYDHRGNLQQRHWDTGAQVISTQFGYDLADRITQITYPSGRQVHYHYDAAGQVTGISTVGEDGTRQSVMDAARYQPFGPLVAMTFGNGMDLSAERDLEYRLSSLAHGSVLDLAYQYDAAGKLLGITDRKDSGSSQVMAYDALGRLGAASGSYGALQYRYDATGNRLAVSRDGVADDYVYDSRSHRLLGTRDWSFAYDASGNLISRIARGDANGDGTFYAYDDRNRLSTVIRRSTLAGQQQDTQLASYVYNAAGQRAVKARDASRLHFVYDLQGRLLAEVDHDGLSRREYIYLGDQAVAVAYTHVLQAPAERGTETVIDDADPQTSQLGGWEPVRKKGAWGDYYHRSQGTDGSFRWHLGSLKNARYEVYAWWPKSRKNNASARFTIQHGGNSSTVTANQATNGKQWVALGTFAFTGTADESIVLSHQGGLTAADGIRLVELVEPPPTISTSVYYIHGDHLGTPRVLTDQAGTVVWQANYRPFGSADIVTAQIEHNLRFPGQYFDSETGLHYNYHRDYDPVLGRYLQSDPIGLEGGIHTYAYARNDPFGLFDPSGLLTVAEANTIGGTIGGAIGGGINGALSGAGIGTSAGSVVPGIGNLAGGVVGASLGAARGAASGALAGAASAELGLGGASLAATLSNGPVAGAAALASEAVRSLLPAPASQLGGGFLGGAIGGISGGPLAIIGGAYGGVIGGAISAAICLGDRECRAELLGEDKRCD